MLLPTAPADPELVGKAVRVMATVWAPLGIARIVAVDRGQLPDPDTMDDEKLVAFGLVCERRGLQMARTDRWAYLDVIWDVGPRAFNHLAGAELRLVDLPAQDPSHELAAQTDAGHVPLPADSAVTGHVVFTAAERRLTVVTLTTTVPSDGDLMGGKALINGASGDALGTGEVVSVDRVGFPGIEAPLFHVYRTRLRHFEPSVGLTLLAQVASVRRWALVDTVWAASAPAMNRVPSGPVPLVNEREVA